MTRTQARVSVGLVLGLLVCLLSMPIPAQAQTVAVTLGWDAPTHRVSGTDCSISGVVLTAAELAIVEYTVSYRVKGTTAWTNREVGTNRTVTLAGLPYLTTYEASVGAHWPGESALCATALLEFKTGAGPAPGTCTNLRKTAP